MTPIELKRKELEDKYNELMKVKVWSIEEREDVHQLRGLIQGLNLGVQMGKDEAKKEFLDVLRNKLIEHNVSNISIRVVMNELKQSLEEKK